MENEKKKTGYRSAWEAQLQETANRILNREKFRYDLNGDALYRQYRERYVQQGRQAMLDTMGQAQAMTGGYGNSYAQSAAQQTYQGYLQGLNDQVPDLYKLALDKYTAEDNRLRGNLSLLLQQDDIDYGRYRDELADRNTAYSKLMALMTGYHYEPTEAELEAAGMTMAQKNAIMQPYYDLLAAQAEAEAAAEAARAAKQAAYEPPKEQKTGQNPFVLMPVAAKNWALWKKMKSSQP